MLFNIALYSSLAIFLAGLIYKMSNWFRCNIGPDAAGFSTSTRISAAARGIVSTVFSARFGTLLKIFVLDVILQMWLLRKDFLRWFAHICIYGGFMLLLLMHGLDALITSVLFDDYYSTLNPFMFLRDFFAVVVICFQAPPSQVDRCRPLRHHHSGRDHDLWYCLGGNKNRVPFKISRDGGRVRGS